LFFSAKAQASDGEKSVSKEESSTEAGLLLNLNLNLGWSF
jgi:hypothetical protein